MKRFKRILFFADSDADESAISRAVALALSNKATLTIMDVIKPVPKAISLVTNVAPPNKLENIVVNEHERMLLDRMAEYSDTSVPMEVIVKIGDPATEIIRHAIAERMDLVIKPADGLSSAGRLFGSVTRSLLRMCPCPVWVLKNELHGKFDRVLAAIDLETDDTPHVNLNQQILELAYSIAKNENAQLHIVSAWGIWMEAPLRRRAGDEVVDRMVGMQETRIRQSLDELLQAPMADDESIHVHLKHGNSADAIRNVADDIEADLIVMGTVCRTGVPGFLIGNTAESIIPELTCSLLALKPDGFVSPIEMASEFSTASDEQPLPLI